MITAQCGVVQAGTESFTGSMGTERRESPLTQGGKVEGGIQRQRRGRLPEAVKNIKENRILKKNYLPVKYLGKKGCLARGFNM